MLPSTWPQVWATAKGVGGQFLSPSISLFWGYWLTAALIAAVVFGVRRRKLAGLLAYLAPASVWLRRSSFNDLALFVLNTLLYSFWLLGPIRLVSQKLATWTWHGLHGALGPVEAPISGLGAELGLSVAAFVVADLGFFVAHLALHRIPILWEFHKVHHSASVLQPLTVMRRHPLSIVVDGTIAGLLLGPLFGLWGWLGAGQVQALTFAGVNVILAVLLAAGFNLQHSHVWLSFGPLDRVLISPATHQLHHSADPAHHDRNFGNFLAVWDRLAGTLLVPGAVAARGEDPGLRFGLGPPGEAWERDYGRVWRLYLVPFVAAGRRVLDRVRG